MDRGRGQRREQVDRKQAHKKAPQVGHPGHRAAAAQAIELQRQPQPQPDKGGDVCQLRAQFPKNDGADTQRNHMFPTRWTQPAWRKRELNMVGNSPKDCRRLKTLSRLSLEATAPFW